MPIRSEICVPKPCPYCQDLMWVKWRTEDFGPCCNKCMANWLFMGDWEYLKQIGIEIPKEITFTKDDWEDFYKTLIEFKTRVMRRHGFHPRDTIHPRTGEVIKYKKTERNS